MHSNRKNEIIYFDERSHGNSFFHLSMAGRTLPNPNYIICHSRKSGALWERYNFEYVISGKGYIETRDKTLPVGKGDLYFLNKLQQHTYYADKQAPYEKLFIVVEGSLADKMLEAHGVTESALVVHADARALFEQIIALSDRHEGQFIDAEAYTEISSILLKLIQLVKPPDFNTTAMDEHPATIIKNYIDYNIYDKITLAEIADTVHLSVSQTERIFKAKYGVSPVRYMLDKKLEVAKHLFITTYLNVTEVSKRLAFSDIKYFSRLFKAKFGQSPSRYMKQQEENPFVSVSRRIE